MQEHTASVQKYTETDIVGMLEFLIDKIRCKYHSSIRQLHNSIHDDHRQKRQYREIIITYRKDNTDPIKNRSEIRCSGRVSFSCPTCGTRCVVFRLIDSIAQHPTGNIYTMGDLWATDILRILSIHINYWVDGALGDKLSTSRDTDPVV